MYVVDIDGDDDGDVNDDMSLWIFIIFCRPTRCGGAKAKAPLHIPVIRKAMWVF